MKTLSESFSLKERTVITKPFTVIILIDKNFKKGSQIAVNMAINVIVSNSSWNGFLKHIYR